MPTNSRRFDLIAVVDFSAAAKPGTIKPKKDRCWMAKSVQGHRLPPVYCRTREDVIDGLLAAIAEVSGPVLIAWDFPFGYPTGSGLGGGRTIATRLAELVQDGPKDANNRFDVARSLNREFGDQAGPFWGYPDGKGDADLPGKKPKPWPFHTFGEMRHAERTAKAQGNHSIHTVWQMNGAGCVGGQAIMGLAAIERLNARLPDPRRARYWPFDTGWETDLDDIVHAECWPTLFPSSKQPHTINDARQVMAVRDALEAANEADGVRELLACPARLTGESRHVVETEEGWILGLQV